MYLFIYLLSPKLYCGILDNLSLYINFKAFTLLNFLISEIVILVLWKYILPQKKAKDLINTYSENKYDIPLSKMTLIENSKLYEYKLVLKEFNLAKNKDEIEIEKLSGYLLIKNK